MAFGKSKRIADDEDIDITPMIDVTFLLLIFFMVTSKMEDQSALQIPPARNGIGVAADQSIVITIFKTPDGGKVCLTDGEDTPNAASLDEVTEYVRKGAADNRKNVIIKADRDVPSGLVDEVAKAANEVSLSGEELTFYLGVVDRPE